MTLGQFTVREFVFGRFRLDGGCMFGSVPKNLWAKRIQPDDENCIPLMARSLMIEAGKRRILVDCGLGDLWAEPQRRIYAIRNVPELDWGFDPESVTDLILTHLHFDHAGGLVRRTSTGSVEGVFPNARIHLQRAQWEQARNPTLKDRASYLPETVQFLGTAPGLTLHDGDVELLPGLFLHRVDGHTRGQQWVELCGGRETLFFPTDVVPTAHHVPLAYHLGYDLCAETLLREKEVLLKRALTERAWVCFQHDAHTAIARIGKSERGQFCVEGNS
jgi:glyoxylase-like metal-dependent hydrolase (beta-lactamase superfamily II)